MAGAAERAADDDPPAGANGDGASGVLAGVGEATELGGGGGIGVELLDEVCGGGGGGGGPALVGAGTTGVTVGAGATAVCDLGVAVVVTGACS